MTVLAVPRPGVDLVPDGWCADVVVPWADAQTATMEVQHAVAQVAALIAAYKTLQSDTLELTKAQRYLEVRWGKLLGPTEKGQRTDLQPSLASEGSELHRMERTRLRQLAAQAETVATRIQEATDVDELSRAALLRTDPHVAHNSGENEWYTPAPIIEAARQVMGAIDLDPASHPAANRIVGATRFYTREDNGLHQDWEGRVWLNPPYAADLVERFTSKLIDEYLRERTTEACLLSNNATETKWFQRVALISNAVCFPSGRISYWQPGTVSKTPLQGQALLYLGGNVAQFSEVFSKFGVVLFR